ncbi:MAG: ABC transporter substrate-binding protein [Lachnospiraceae bacterium]
MISKFLWCSIISYSIEFEPGATTLETGNKGHVVASLGTDSGYVPYTAFCAKNSYLKENDETIQGFTNALQKGMEYVKNHTPEEIAKVITPQFKETDMKTLTAIVTRYYDQDTWNENLIFTKDSFDLLQDILEGAKELKHRVPYQDLVTTKYAEKAQKK